MNRAIVRLFAVIMLLFGVLVAFTSRATVFDATALQNNPLNRLAVFASWKVKRGRILADNGVTVLAKSLPATGGIWSRSYPQGSLFAQAVGYSNQQEEASAGMEQYFTPQLSGPTSALAKVFGSLNGGTKVGDDVYSTLDPRAQRLARSLLSHGGFDGQPATGAVVAIVPQTGAVKVMYSSPTYDDNHPGRYTKPSDCAPNPFDNGCQFNLAVAGRFPPGSTFKLVTTTAALNSGKYTPQSLTSGPSPLTVSGRPLENDGNQPYGPTSLTQALTYSINTIYAQVGQNVGDKLMLEYMRRYGFYSTPPLQYPANEMNASGELDSQTGHLVRPPGPCTSYYNCVDLGRMSIGQDKLGVTPLQMAMVVAGIADDGKLMEPRLATKVVNQEGQVVQRYPPTVYDQVMRPKMAKELQTMMRDVVEEGTGQAANLEHLPIAGKTGTASTGQNAPNGEPYDDAWFVGFPISDPRIAVAVMLEKIPEGYGGQYAAPIAAKMIQTLLAEDR
ncbi:MAG: peptidoglycan D,D-transpeptidase FtsI family protein [Solirubrobacteraceae bacterium]